MTFRFCISVSPIVIFLWFLCKYHRIIEQYHYIKSFLQIMLADSDLRLTGGTNPVFAPICNTSPYLFEFSPFIILTNPEKNTNEFIYKQWFVAKIDRWRPSYFKEQVTPEIFHLPPKWLATYGIIQLLGGNTLVCSIVTTGIATVRIVRYIRNISE
jgi:hypothetical protein